MNPVYTGKDVSYIDTKQAQRAIETAVAEAERFATLAWLAGAPFPHAALDKAWRLLAYGAHHDGITGVESDQVYLDLVGGWREAWELGSAARRDAVQLPGPGTAAPGGPAVRVFNGLARARERDGHASRWRCRTTAPGGSSSATRRDRPCPALAEGVRRREDGSLAEVTLTFLARDVPALGYRTYQVAPAGDREPAAAAWRDVSRGALRHRERPVPGHRGSGAGRDGERHRQAHRGQRAGRARQRAGDPGRVRAAPQARRGPVAPVAQGTGNGLGVGPGHGAGAAVPGRKPAGRLVHARRARGDPGDGALGRTPIGSSSAPTSTGTAGTTGCCGSASRPTCPAGCRCTRPRRR